MLTIRPIRVTDNAAVRRVVQTVMPEFGCVGQGFSIEDPELLDMFATYTSPRSAYYVLTVHGGTVVGVGGLAPLRGGFDDVCELRKMYILPGYRGLGGGKLILEACLRRARDFGFTRMYLETVAGMTTASAVYLKYGFRYLDGPMGATGHSGCDRFMVKELKES